MFICLWGFYFEVVPLIKLMMSDKLENSIKCGCAVPSTPSSLLFCAGNLISNHDGDIFVGRVTPWKTFVFIAQRIGRQLQR